MFEYVAFTREEGEKKERKLLLFAISTCGFCKKAKQFLRENHYTFAWVDVDLIEPEQKKKIAVEFQKKFDARLMYPCLVIDEGDYLLSFIRYQWEKVFGREE